MVMYVHVCTVLCTKQVINSVLMVLQLRAMYRHLYSSSELLVVMISSYVYLNQRSFEYYRWIMYPYLTLTKAIFV